MSALDPAAGGSLPPAPRTTLIGFGVAALLLAAFGLLLWLSPATFGPLAELETSEGARIAPILAILAGVLALVAVWAIFAALRSWKADSRDAVIARHLGARATAQSRRMRVMLATSREMNAAGIKFPMDFPQHFSVAIADNGISLWAGTIDEPIELGRVGWDRIISVSRVSIPIPFSIGRAPGIIVLIQNPKNRGGLPLRLPLPIYGGGPGGIYNANQMQIAKLVSAATAGKAASRGRGNSGRY